MMVEVDNSVNGADWVSDESSFYGDGDEQDRLEALTSGFDTEEYWQYHPRIINNVAFGARNKATMAAYTSADLYNPYEGMESARQLKETPAQFVRRLPPGRSPFNWLWCANPYPPSGKNEKAQPAEDENKFRNRACALLDTYDEKKKKYEKENPERPQGYITRKLKPERDSLQTGLLKAAKDAGMTSGKWMLFPKIDDAPRIWKAVCEGVINNKLGPTAKIVGYSDDKDDKILLICVYTRDFSDQADVQRVAEELANMGLIAWPGGTAAFSTVYYKCDAYTILEINSVNPYNLKTSLYNSKDVLTAAKNKPGAQGMELGGSTSVLKRSREKENIVPSPLPEVGIIGSKLTKRKVIDVD